MSSAPWRDARGRAGMYILVKEILHGYLEYYLSQEKSQK